MLLMGRLIARPPADRYGGPARGWTALKRAVRFLVRRLSVAAACYAGYVAIVYALRPHVTRTRG